LTNLKPLDVAVVGGGWFAVGYVRVVPESWKVEIARSFGARSSLATQMAVASPSAAVSPITSLADGSLRYCDSRSEVERLGREVA